MYSKILLKLSGESLSSKTDAFDVEILERVALEIKEIHDQGIDLGIVCGGGNFVRGRTLSALGIKRESADTMGMLGTVMNSIALESKLNELGVKAKAFAALEMPQVIAPYRQDEVEECFKNHMVVLFACGVGNPYFSTDTGCALRAIEIRADLVLLAKNGVDGVYDSDPDVNADAKKYDVITYDEMLAKNLKVIDLTAASLLKDNKMSAYVFDMKEAGNIIKVIKGQDIGTKIIVKE